jgi:hypothetical protein
MSSSMRFAMKKTFCLGLGVLWMMFAGLGCGGGGGASGDVVEEMTQEEREAKTAEAAEMARKSQEAAVKGQRPGGR